MFEMLLDLVPLSRRGLGGRIGLDQGRGIGTRDQLDPAVTTLLENCVQWPARVGRISVRHDHAGVIARWQPKLEIWAGPNAYQEVGRYWEEHGMPLPLDLDGIELVRSHDYRQVQIADVLAGASVSWLGQFASGPCHQPASFLDGLGQTVLPHLIENEVWPMPLVDGNRF